jgi:negative regulator of sigma E activity
MNVNQPHPDREELFAYRDGELKSDRRVIIEAHVLGCHACRELIDDVSRMEADLSVGAPVPKDAYFERLSERVMAKVVAADTAPALERRRPDAEADWEENRALKPKLPWFALVSTASAAAAVIVVGVLLVREGAVLRSPPSVAVLERSAPDAARSGAMRDSATATSPGARSDENERADQQIKADGKVEADKLGANEPAPKPADQATVQENQREGVKQQVGEFALEKDSVARSKASSSSGSDELASGAGARNEAPSTRAAAPDASRKTLGANAAEPVGVELKSLLDRYGLPPVWGPGVSDDLVLRAEPALRNLYRIGAAATAPDSARVRLYLAEAARVRAGAAPDSTAIEDIVHHYRRAIRLAGSDAEIRRVAAERLTDFLNELGDEPALHSP